MPFMSDKYQNVPTSDGSFRIMRPNSWRMVNPANECNKLLTRVIELEEAIKEHRASFVMEAMVTEEDRELWRVLGDEDG